MESDRKELIFNDSKSSSESCEEAENMVDMAGYQVTKAELFFAYKGACHYNVGHPHQI